MASRIPALAMLALVLLSTLTLSTSAGAAALSDARAERWVERDGETLRFAAAALVTKRLAEPFTRIEDRVPEYGNWVYGWLSSIYVSARLLGVGAQTAGGQIWRQGTIDQDAIVGDLETYVGNAFEDQVIVPDVAERDLEEAWADTVHQLRRLDARLASARAERGAPPAFAEPLLGAWEPGQPPRLRDGPRSVLLDEAEDPEHADLVLRRSVRPLSIRALSAATRLVIVPVVIPLVGGAAAVPLFDTGGFAGASLFSGVIAAGLWATDYLINWIDSAWNRPGFEAELRGVIRAQRDRTIADARGHLDATLCSAAPAVC